MEKQKQNQQNTPSDTKLALSPEQEKQLQKEKEQVLLLSKIQRGSLSNESLSTYLQKYHEVDISKYSPEIKQKFLEEISMLFEEFKDFDESMITKLKSIREEMSFWLEEWKSSEYYRNMIIWNAIESRVKVLQETINTQYWETMELKWTKVNKADFTHFETNIRNLDTQNGVNVFESVLSKLRPAINGWLNFNTLNFQEIFKKECIKSWVKYNDELYKEYNKVYQAFVWKNMVFNAKDGNGIIKYKWKWFWFSSWWINGLTSERLKDIYKDKVEAINLEKMGTADLVILLRVLFWIVPVAWDVVWWYDDGKQALAWINFDWSMHWLWENTFMYLISGLQLSIVWGTFAKLAKWPRLAKVMITIWKIIDKLLKSPEMLKDLAKNEKIVRMLEVMKGLVPNIEVLLQKIKQPKIVVENINTNALSNKEKLPKVKRLQKLEQTKDSLYYNSHFSTEIPESLKSQNPLAWKNTEDEKIIQSFQKSGKPTQESYLEQLNILSKIPNEIMQYLDNLDISLFRKKNFHYIYSDVLEKVSDKLTYFSSTQLENIKSKIRLYIERKIIVHKYFDDFKDNPKKLLAQHWDIDIWLIEKEVEMKIMWPNIVFIVDPMEFNKIISWWKNYSINFWGWIFINKWEIKELEWSFIIISWNNNTALMHEFQHSLNWYMMPERFSEMSRSNPLSKAKDEIIAFIKEGALFLTIKERLNSRYYDYFNIQNKNYSELKSKYLTELNTYIDIAERLMKKWVSLEQLQITPIEKWYRLDKIIKLNVIKIEKTKEFSDGVFAWKIIYEGWILFEWIFNSQWEIINGIKRYKDFYEEWVFWAWGKIYTWKLNSFFNFDKTIIDYERDLKSSQLLALLKNN